MKLHFIFLFILLYNACSEPKITSKEAIAKVYDKYLLRSEVVQLIPPGSTKQDSTLIAQNYVRKWITRELLLQKALQNLTDEEKNIRQQVEAYSSAILIHKYKEKLISQKVGHQIEDAEIEQYYEQHKFNFVLNTDVVRAQLIILPKSVSNLEKARAWFRSNDAKSQAALEEYCLTNAKKFDNFDNQWVELRHLLNILPIQAEEWQKKYKFQNHIEVEDNENYYFLKINETCKEQELAPLDYVKNSIKTILRNKRKITFEEELEKQINQEGRRKNNVEIYLPFQ